MKLFEVVEKLQDTYNSIDLRVVAFKQDNVWKAAMLVLRFRRENVDELKKTHDELLDKIGRIEDEDFCVKLYSLPIDKWNSIKENFSQKFVCLEPNFAVNFDKDVHINRDVFSPSNYYWDYVSTEWNCYYANGRCLHDANVTAKIHNNDKKAQLLKFKDMFSYLSVAFAIEENQLQNDDGLLLVQAPAFFKILETTFDDGSINLKGRGYSNKDVEIVIDFYQTRSGSDPNIWKDRVSIPHTIKGNSQIVDFSINHSVPKLDVNDGFQLSVHRKEGLLLEQDSINSVGNHWPTKSRITNPIYPIFKEFVQIDELKKMLLQSESKSGKKNSDNFEKAVSWLISILGLNAIWLGKDYESTGSNEERIVIDLIGHNNSNHIFLINATTGIPTTSDFARERRYRENLQNKINNPNLIVSSILFSNGSVTNLIDAANLEGVLLIGRDEIEFLLGLIEKGNNDIAREYITRENIEF